jgi:hypothetical protein
MSLNKSLVAPVSAASRRLWPKLTSAAGLLIALAGALAAPEAIPVESLPTRISVPLPDWLVVSAVAALSIASLIFIAMIFPRPRPRRKKGEDDFQLYREPQKIPPLVAAALLMLSLMPGAILVGAIVWLGKSDIAIVPHAGSLQSGIPHPQALPSANSDRFEAPARPASDITTGLAATLALLVGFGSLGFVLWLRFGGRLHRWPEAFKDLHRPLAAAVDDSLDALRQEADARIAIIRSYGNFERALANASFPRRPWETPVEFMRAALRRLPLPAVAVSRLTDLFELARFSQHPIGAEQRESALRSLIEIREALQQETSDAAAS